MLAESPKNISLPIKWHGGKSYLADQIIRLIPPHIHYVEPYFGGGSVLFNKPIELVDQHSEVVNDIYGDLINFWEVLKSKKLFPEFQRQVSLTPFSKHSWELSIENRSGSRVERACNFFVRYRQSRQGLGRDFATMSRSRTRRGMNEQVSSWLSAIDGLQSAHERLSRVVILCEDAVEVIRREDSTDTFFYLDPPYLAATRVVDQAYSHEMDDEAHERLLTTLAKVSGKFILSGYDSPLYERFRSRSRWSRTDIKIDNKASSQKSKPTKTECLWRNY
jgi:DNA adenine methylase